MITAGDGTPLESEPQNENVLISQNNFLIKVEERESGVESPLEEGAVPGTMLGNKDEDTNLASTVYET